MISLLLSINSLFRAIRRSAGDQKFRALGILVVALLACGTLFYTGAEDWNLLDSFYFCVMTMTTIGYGDLAPTTALSKFFTTVYAFISIGAFVSFAAKLATGLLGSESIENDK